MPYSDDVFNEHIASFIGALRPATLCDIGPGAGKYGQMARRAAQDGGFQIKLTGVEVDPAYVEQFNLRTLYDELIIGDAIHLIERLDLKYDLVIIGDVIEHLRKSDGIDLLNYMLYRVSYVCVIYLTEYVQEGTEDHPREAHISTWSRGDFRDWNTFHATSGFMNIALIKGYQPAAVSLSRARLNEIFANTLGKRFVRRAKRFIKSTVFPSLDAMGIDTEMILKKIKNGRAIAGSKRRT